MILSIVSPSDGAVKPRRCTATLGAVEAMQPFALDIGAQPHGAGLAGDVERQV